MPERLVIIGAGGHGKVVADIALKLGYTDIAFLDDCVSGERMGIPVLGTCQDIPRCNDGKTEFVLGIGSNSKRKCIAQAHDIPWATLVHPSAQISAGTVMGEGTVVMAGAVINACANVGKHCIINTGAIVEHDNVLSDYVHISPRAALGGAVKVGELTHIGIGAAVRNNGTIAPDCVIGAGAAVVGDIVRSGVYVGIPARKMAR